MREDVEAGSGDERGRGLLIRPGEVGRQGFEENGRRSVDGSRVSGSLVKSERGMSLLFDLANRLSNVGCPSIRQICDAPQSSVRPDLPAEGKVKRGALTVSIDARHDDVSNTPASDSLGRILGLVRIQWWRKTGRLDGAEAARTGAGVSHQLPCHIRTRALRDKGSRGRTMMVAVASPLLPPQHWPIFGHLASSHTVCKPNPLRSFLILLKLADVGTDVFRYAGRRGFLVLPRAIREGEGEGEVTRRSTSPETKSAKVRPSSVKRDLLDEGVGSGVAAVAKERTSRGCTIRLALCEVTPANWFGC